ncbi:MAG TPA: hypothetical protein DDX37_02335 [Candidatus Omnitrophica bacterium]|nr:hypothetical protein [Candidatus Omnitrophota bacterium]
MERKERNILIYAELDHMKWINNDFGHAKGDKALVLHKR